MMKSTPLLHLIVSSVLLSILFACRNDQADTEMPVAHPPPIDSSLIAMHPELLIADSLVNAWNYDSARAHYESLYRRREALSSREALVTTLRLALTIVQNDLFVVEAGDREEIARLLFEYQAMAGQAEESHATCEAEREYILGKLAMQSSLDEAEDHFRRAAAICLEGGNVDPRNAQRLLSDIAIQHVFVMERPAFGIEALHAESELLDAYAYPDLEYFQNFYYFSVAYRDLDQFELSETMALRAIAWHRQKGLKKPRLRLQALNCMMYNGVLQGDTVQVQRYADSVLSIIDTVYQGDTLEIVLDLANYIISFRHSLTMTRRLADKAIRMSAGYYPVEHANILRARAYTYLNHGLVEEARADFTESVEIMERENINTLYDLSGYFDALLGLAGLILNNFDDIENAFSSLNKSSRLFFERDLHNLTQDADPPEIAQHEKWYDYLKYYALYLFRRFELYQDTASLYEALRVNEKIDEVLVYDRRKVAEEDILRYASIQHSAYSRMLRMTHAAYVLDPSGDALSSAHRYMERSRAYLVESQISFRQAAERLKIPPDILKEGEQLSKEEGTLISTIDDRNASPEWKDLTLRKEKYLRRLKTQYPGLYDTFLSNDLVSLTELRMAIPDSVMVLEYQMLDSQVYIVAVTQDTAILISHLLDTAKIEQLLTTISSRPESAPSTDDVNEYVDLARGVYQMLIGPVEPFMAGLSTLYIIPDGTLQYLPFEALVGKSHSGDSFEKLPFLFREFHVGYAISSGTLFRSLSSEPEISRVAAFAFYPRKTLIDKVFGTGSRDVDTKFPALPGALREAMSIVKIFGSEDVSTYYKDDCTVQQLFAAAERADVLHLGLHAFADPDNRYRSGIVLRDSILNAADLIGLDLQADIIVLSGCETGNGKQVSGEGLFNFARPFVMAGAHHVVMSRWLLHDHTASILMKEFYQSLYEGTDVHIALSEAKRAFFRQSARPLTAHPYYWSLMSAQ